MLKILTDSTNNLSDELIRRYDIRIAPIAIQFKEETYEENINIDRTLFYNKIEEMGIIPTTSQPAPAAFARFYQDLREEGNSGLVITVTAKLSGTYDSALMAKEMVPEAEVAVFDSASISLGTGWMVLEAARAAGAGQPLDQVLRRLEHIRSTSKLVLTPATLKYLQMSGRVGRLQGALASLLDVKPIIYLQDGLLEAGESVRTRSKALDRLVEVMTGTFAADVPLKAAVIHARAEAEAEDVKRQLQSHLTIDELLVEDLVASLAVHGGPGILGVFAYPA
ncbi:MAG: DegV family protein [Anaerolineales bacterium]|jgi:DegV family protein with EDD domain